MNSASTLTCTNAGCMTLRQFQDEAKGQVKKRSLNHSLLLAAGHTMTKWQHLAHTGRMHLTKPLVHKCPFHIGSELDEQIAVPLT